MAAGFSLGLCCSAGVPVQAAKQMGQKRRTMAVQLRRQPTAHLCLHKPRTAAATTAVVAAAQIAAVPQQVQEAVPHPADPKGRATASPAGRAVHQARAHHSSQARGAALHSRHQTRGAVGIPGHKIKTTNPQLLSRLRLLGVSPGAAHSKRPGGSRSQHQRRQTQREQQRRQQRPSGSGRKWRLPRRQHPKPRGSRCSS